MEAAVADELATCTVREGRTQAENKTQAENRMHHQQQQHHHLQALIPSHSYLISGSLRNVNALNGYAEGAASDLHHFGVQALAHLHAALR
jgi:hypothetical protein